MPQNNRRVKRREVVTRRESKANVRSFLNRVRQEKVDMLWNAKITDPMQIAMVMSQCDRTLESFMHAYDVTTEQLKQQKLARKNLRMLKDRGST